MNIKKIMTTLLASVVTMGSLAFTEEVPAQTFKPLIADQIVAASAILIDQESGQILFEKDAHTQRYPASTTKVMTAILVLEDMDLDKTITVDDKSPFTEGSKIALDLKEQMTIEQLLYATMVESANDAAAALAVAHSGSVEAFALRMNEKAKEIGALNTNFTNPHGLTEKEHLSTAYDLALIGRYAMTFPKFREIVSTVRYQIPPTNTKDETRFITTSNRFLYGTGSKNKIEYKGKLRDIKTDYITGMKTGYTDAARQTFIVSAERDGKKLIAVILKSEGKALYTDTLTMIDHGLDMYDRYTVVNGDDLLETIQFDDLKSTKVEAVAKHTVTGLLPIGTSPTSLERNMTILPDIALPVKAGQVVGTLEFVLNGKSMGQTDLIAPADASDQLLLTSETISLIKEPGVWYEEIPWLNLFIKLLATLFLWRFAMTLFHAYRLRSIRREKARKLSEQES